MSPGEEREVINRCSGTFKQFNPYEYKTAYKGFR